ncbi:MAG TPA: disulfide bond formation protein B [Patescibacteria group bacterium]|nr:disulfide bond formation protein B [Patescibacteria group bacterium]
MKKLCDVFANPARLALFLALASMGALAFALTMEYAFNKLPCHLCYLQRQPYKFAIVLALLALVSSKKAPRLAVPFLLLTGLCFLVDMAIAGFHFGTEMKWWPLASGCGGEGASPPLGSSVEELKRYLENRPIVRCDVPGWVFLGISMTGWNFIYATGLALTTFYFTLKGRCHGKKA